MRSGIGKAGARLRARCGRRQKLQQSRRQYHRPTTGYPGMETENEPLRRPDNLDVREEQRTLCGETTSGAVVPRMDRQRTCRLHACQEQRAARQTITNLRSKRMSLQSNWPHTRLSRRSRSQRLTSRTQHFLRLSMCMHQTLRWLSHLEPINMIPS